MTRTRDALAIAALALLLAAPAMAQDSPTEEPEAPLAEPAESTPPAEDTDTSADAPADGTEAIVDEDAGGDDAGDLAAPELLEVVRDTFDDWEVRCAPEGDECFVYQLANDPEGNPVAEFSLIRLPEAGEAAAGATVVTPLGTLLPAGLVLQVDTGEQRQYPYSWCSQVGCFARFGFSDDSIAAMKRGAVAKLTLASIVAPDQPVTLEISLKGFTAAFDSLEPTEGVN